MPAANEASRALLRPAFENLQGTKPREMGCGSAAGYGDLSVPDAANDARLGGAAGWLAAIRRASAGRCELNGKVWCANCCDIRMFERVRSRPVENWSRERMNVWDGVDAVMRYRS
jgi:hypothetical protein